MPTYQIYEIIGTALTCIGIILMFIFIGYSILEHVPAAIKMIRPKEAREQLKKLESERRAAAIAAKEHAAALQRTIEAAKLEAQLEESRRALIDGTAFSEGVSSEELAAVQKRRKQVIVSIPALPALSTQYKVSEQRFLQSTQIIQA